MAFLYMPTASQRKDLDLPHYSFPFTHQPPLRCCLEATSNLIVGALSTAKSHIALLRFAGAESHERSQRCSPYSCRSRHSFSFDEICRTSKVIRPNMEGILEKPPMDWKNASSKVWNFQQFLDQYSLHHLVNIQEINNSHPTPIPSLAINYEEKNPKNLGLKTNSNICFIYCSNHPILSDSGFSSSSKGCTLSKSHQSTSDVKYL